MHTVCVAIDFCAGHRLVGHEGKCANYHGHNYRAEIYASARELDDIGRVVDFSILKKELKRWIDFNWDHGMILRETDPMVKWCTTQMFSKVYSMADNPTAENMARILCDVAITASSTLPGRLVVIDKVRLFETPNCFAEYSPLASSI